MTTPSLFELTGLSIHVSQSVLMGQSYIDVLTNRFDSYTHTMSAAMGFDTCTIEINGDLPYCEDWFENGLLRDITVYNSAGYIAWQGWVNQISLSVSGLSITRGPITDIANRAQVVYSPLDTSITPPAVGTRTIAAATNNTGSQAYFGIWHKIVSAGKATAAQAAQVQATYLGDYWLPECSSSLNFDGGDAPKITLSCVGYGYWLQAYPYNVAGTGTVALSTRIQAVIAASTNAVFSTNYSGISSNTFAVAFEENDSKTAFEYIKGLVAVGDAGGNRWTFGIYENRMAYYLAIPTTAEYQYRLSEGSQVITLTADNSRVQPWDVRPAKWTFISDFLIGRVPSTTFMRDDPRMLFIESLTYSAPYSLQLQGAKINKLPQRIAQLGLGGM